MKNYTKEENEVRAHKLVWMLEELRSASHSLIRAKHLMNDLDYNLLELAGSINGTIKEINDFNVVLVSKADAILVEPSQHNGHSPQTIHDTKDEE